MTNSKRLPQYLDHLRNHPRFSELEDLVQSDDLFNVLKTDPELASIYWGAEPFGLFDDPDASSDSARTKAKAKPADNTADEKPKKSSAKKKVGTKKSSAKKKAQKRKSQTKAKADPDDNGLQYRRLSDVSPRDIDWLWLHWIARKMVNIFEGDPGVGKSTILADLMARVTTGREMPDGSPGVKGAVVLVGAEDAVEETIKPKAMAMGADDSLIYVVGIQRDEDGELIPLSVPEDLHRLEKLIDKVGAVLVIFDPINAYLTEGTDYFKDPSVRRALTPLVDTADKTGAAVVMVRHLRKDKRGIDAISVGQGSIAFTGISRSVLVAGRHPEQPDTFALVRSKSNIAPYVKGHRYHLVEYSSELPVAVVEWGEAEHLDPNDVVRGPDARRKSPRRDEAREAILEMLAEGPVPVSAIKKAQQKSGISWSTWEAAKDELGVHSKKEWNETGFGVKEWFWALPVHMDKGGKITLRSMGNGDDEDSA